MKIPKTKETMMNGEERNALNQIAKLDRRIVDDNTTVRLDRTTRSKDGNKIKKYIVAQGDRVKYEAKFTEKNGRQKLDQIVFVRRTENLPANKAEKMKGRRND